MEGKEDEEHLRYATSLGLTLYTYNRGDYMALHTMFLEQGLTHTGIILCPQNRFSVGEQMRRAMRVVEAKTAEEMRDQALFLGNWG